jgi:hypothetical protein
MRKRKKKEEKEYSWTLGFILGSIFIGLISLSIFLTLREKTDLDKNGVFTVGTIIRTYEIKSRGTFIEYMFVFDGKVYKDHQSVHVEVNQGECYMVKYSKKNPEHCKMIFTEKKACN